MRNLICIISILIWCSFLFGQSYEIDEIFELSIENTGIIYNGDKVEGHYIFFISGKKKHDNYVLRILNPELNPVRDIDIRVGADLLFMKAVSNGTSIAMSLFDYDNSEMITMIYSLSGDLVLTERYKLGGSLEVRAMKETIMGSYGKDGLIPISGIGYLNLLPKKYSKLGYEIYLLNEDGSSSVIDIKKDLSSQETIKCVANNEGIVYNLITSVPKPNVSSKNSKTQLSVIDLRSKKETLRKELKSTIYVETFNTEGENVSLYGVEFANDSRLFDKVEGLVKLTFDKSGNLVSEYRHVFDYDKLLTAKQIKKNNKLFPQEFFFDKQNNITIIAEMKQTKKGVSSQNIHELKFNSKFELLSNKLFPTAKFELYYACVGEQYNCMKMIAPVCKFSQTNNDDYTYVYSNKDENKNWYYEVRSSIGGERISEKIFGRKEGVRRSVYKAKFGYILLIDHDGKNRTVNMSLEKLNF